MSAGESFAGITVPDGEPGALLASAGQFGAAAEGLASAAGELMGLPGGMAAWQGPASVAFAGSCQDGAAALDAASGALRTASLAGRSFGRDLEEAQDDARRAIRDARDAKERIAQAKAAIAEAQADQRAAAAQAEHANHVLAVSASAGAPSPGAEADLAAAARASDDAARREQAARRRLEEAEDDLADAQRRGREAEERARTAARSTSAAFGAAEAPPGLGLTVGAPAHGVGGGGAAPVYTAAPFVGGGAGTSAGRPTNAFSSEPFTLDPLIQRGMTLARREQVREAYLREADPHQSAADRLVFGPVDRLGRPLSQEGNALGGLANLARRALGGGRRYASARARALVHRQANQVAVRQVPLPYKRPYTANNFRENLMMRTGQSPPPDVHAHHVFPKAPSLARQFRQRGVEPNDPEYGAWWQAAGHLPTARAYNDTWATFFRRYPNATKDEVLAFGRRLAKDHGLSTGF